MDEAPALPVAARAARQALSNPKVHLVFGDAILAQPAACDAPDDRLTSAQSGS
jgi:hypothetical protein